MQVALSILSSKKTWLAISSTALLAAGLLFYFASFGPITAQKEADSQAIEDFEQCLTARLVSENLKACDRFYLDYLPKKTDPVFKQNIVEVAKLDQKQIVRTYRDVNRLLKDHGLAPYPELYLLSHGQLVDYIQ